MLSLYPRATHRTIQRDIPRLTMLQPMPQSARLALNAVQDHRVVPESSPQLRTSFQAEGVRLPVGSGEWILTFLHPCHLNYAHKSLLGRCNELPLPQSFLVPRSMVSVCVLPML